LSKTVNIIGSGISGLTAGCYLQMCGFKTEIFEKHSNPGGLCTSWKRNGYIINLSAHWIIGSGKGSSFYKLWSELIDMESIKFHNHDLKIDIQLNKNKNKNGSNIFHLYSNLKKFEKYLIDLSPEDERTIRQFTKHIRLLQKFDLPPIDKKQSLFPTLFNNLKKIKYLEILPIVYKWSRQTNVDFAQKFKSPFLREAFSLLYDDEKVKMLVFALPLAYFDNKSAGCPIGGSLIIAKKLEEKYISLGGKINFNADVKKIIVDKNKAIGLIYNNEQISNSNIVLSTADWHFTFFNLLNKEYRNKDTDELSKSKKYEVFFSSMLFSIGIKKDLGYLPHFFRFPLKKEIVSPDGTIYKRLEIEISNFDEVIVPKGKTLISVNLYTKNGDYWINLRRTDFELYNKLKNDFCNLIIDAIGAYIGKIKDDIDMIDVATPATIQRYTNSWKGSTQGWLPSKNFLSSTTCAFNLKEVKNFYYSSHWSTAGGGLPVVIKNSREVTKLICKNNKLKFIF